MSDPDKPADATIDLPRSEGPGGRVGPFKILQQLGEGGFGSVFEAEQEQPVKRRVALKVIKLGMDTREVIARFEAERQALAMMDHPHIARVLDAGATESGRPYFVMELVKGEPITTYCTRHGLSLTQRLELFEQVCSAVQHAHTKGIIHRDLKPSNVLVSTHDDKAFAKVIDFGIAKATSGRLTDRTLFTEANLMMGTPLYMSPEQAEGSADIDTRTDIYALGVILYQLLTDSTPLDSDSLRAAGYAEVQRIIREVEPPRPSAKLSMSARRQILGADTQRAMDPSRLARVVRGELDWIAMKAIEKDRARRYETASALSADVRRYLSGAPVLAAPPSATYRMGKFVRRNKVPVVAGALILLALMVGLIGFAWQAHIANERASELEQVSKFQAAMLKQVDPTGAGRALSDDVQAKFATALTKAGMPEAERARQAESFAAQWRRVNATDAARDLIDTTILKPAIVAIDKQFRQQPLVDASLRQVLADRYKDMGLYDAAMPLQKSALATRRRVLGNDNPDTLESINSMGLLLDAQTKYGEAGPYLKEGLATSRRVLGGDNPDTLNAIASMGQLLDDEGKLDQAEPYFREALEKRQRVLGKDAPDTVDSMSSMAGLLLDEDKPEEAESYYRQALEKYRRINGDDDPETVITINNLGITLLHESKLAQAEPYLREALEKHRVLQGEENPDTLSSLVNLGGVLLVERKLDEAEPYLRESVEKSRRVFGNDNNNTLLAIITLGKLLDDQDKAAEAKALLLPAEPAVRKTLAEDSPPQFAMFVVSLGRARAGTGEFAAAEGNLLEAQSVYAKNGALKGRQGHECIQALIDFYTAWNKAEPGKGHDAKAAQWQKTMDGLRAGAGAAVSH